MTFSIVAHADGQWGVAVASKFLAVGGFVPAARWDVGALATQAWANLQYGPDGLALLQEGRFAADVVEALTGKDPMREHRQLGVVDRYGESATWTGAECNAWAGDRSGPGYAAQGNILTGPEGLASMGEPGGPRGGRLDVRGEHRAAGRAAARRAARRRPRGR